MVPWRFQQYTGEFNRRLEDLTEAITLFASGPQAQFALIVEVTEVAVVL